MTDHLHALAMRTKAAEAVNSACERVIHSGERRFIDGVRLGHDRSEAAILALPLEADHAALVREAVKLPEIAALVEFATHVSDGDSADYTDNWKLALAALQPFLALETP